MPARVSAVRLVLVLCSLSGASVVLAAKIYLYTATTAAPVLREGAVQAGALLWQCSGRRCAISGPWEQPAVQACASLASVVGKISAYGRIGAMLGQQELALCNAHAAVSAQSPNFTPNGNQPRWKGEPPPPFKRDPAPTYVHDGKKRDTTPPVAVAVEELSVVGGAVDGAIESSAGSPIAITTGELSVVGGAVGSLGPSAKTLAPIAISVPELSVVGQ